MRPAAENVVVDNQLTERDALLELIEQQLIGAKALKTITLGNLIGRPLRTID
jgi:hypothetical protein